MGQRIHTMLNPDHYEAEMLHRNKDRSAIYNAFDTYNLLFTGRSSGLHISFNSLVAFTISGLTWSSDVIPSSLIPVANSSESTV
jgi:hypothetical protein